MVDWWETVKERFSHIKTLLINLDNGPENHSRRTQFMQRLVEFVQRYRITDTLGLLSAVPQQVQCDRTLLGDFRTVGAIVAFSEHESQVTVTLDGT